ncbi:MAG: FprA family A-type flavoprotein, partial [Thaumarchaeota archaeon]|jgi:flavorubredoxin|nr:FprA family A-type flavoprotein [Candidatus Terraquivivens yellowstonensis]MCL7397421.1 FprA family A-type flavoprotein [Candidatus Terraquivivens yellowstonensis]
MKAVGDTSPRIISREIESGFYLLRVDDEKVNYFEAIWSIPERITYNAYLLVEDGGAVLFDGWKTVYADDLIEAIRGIVSPRDLTHVIVHHVEPDHSGSLPKVLEANGFRAEVVTNPMSKPMIESFYKICPKFRLVKDCEEISAAGEKIKLINTPWLHWPETMMSYLTNRRILVPCDAFGGYSIPRTILDEDDEVVREYLPSVRKYVATVIGFYRQYIIRNIERLQNLQLDIEIIAPAHGLIWKRNPRLILDYYRSLAEGRPDGNKILVVSGSMYGLMEKAARIAVEEVERLGGRTAFYQFNDLEQPPFSEIIGNAIDSRAIILAAPTYEAGVYPPIDHLADLITKKIPPKPVLILGSYGWAGIVAKKLSEKLTGAGFKVVEMIEFRGSPSEEDVRRIKEGVRRLLESS